MNLNPAEKQALHARDWPHPGKRQHKDSFTSKYINQSLRPEAEADFDEPPASTFNTDGSADASSGIESGIGVTARGIAVEAEDEGAGVPGSEAEAMTGAVDEEDDRGGSAAERDSDDL
ncbi:hypothetical protein BDW72DRAFT_198132 [Aspergillus terricola var. indicus]